MRSTRLLLIVLLLHLQRRFGLVFAFVLILVIVETPVQGYYTAEADHHAKYCFHNVLPL